MVYNITVRNARIHWNQYLHKPHCASQRENAQQEDQSVIKVEVKRKGPMVSSWLSSYLTICLQQILRIASQTIVSQKLDPLFCMASGYFMLNSQLIRYHRNELRVRWFRLADINRVAK